MRKKLVFTFVVLASLCLASPRVWALAVGANWDIHMDIPGVIANDFHVEGRIESGTPGGNWSEPPVLIQHIDGKFPNFVPTIVPDMTDPGQNWYIFKADWSGADYVYCEVLHLGLQFDVTCHNVIIDLVGWWTINGQRLPPPPNGPPNGGAVPLPGFNVRDQVVGSPQFMSLHNDSHLFGEGISQQGIPMSIVQLDAVSMTAEEMELLFGSPERAFAELRLGGAQEQLPWKHAMNRNGPIGFDNPIPAPPDSFFDVFFLPEGPPPDSFFDIWVELDIPAGGFLLARELVEYINNAGEPELRWHWEIHGAHEGSLYDLGDAPDSSNSFAVPMMAYPAAGVMASYPTVFAAGSPPHGPRHLQQRGAALLGMVITREDEADIGLDQDGLNNIDPPLNMPDRDNGDDSVMVPLALPHCQTTRFQYTVTILPASMYPPLYVNVWFDFNRDGDWDDILQCPGAAGATPAPEWAVQNQQLPTGLLPGVYTMTTPAFTSWNPPGMQPQEIWMRITLAEQPWSPVVGAPGYGGSGPATGYQYGETEDYYFVPKSGPTPPRDPILRVGDWINPEPWHNWIAPSPDPIPVQLLITDPCSIITQVDFFYSLDGTNWVMFGSDMDGTQPYEDTQGSAGNVGDGWAAYFVGAQIPPITQTRPIMFMAEAQSPLGAVSAQAERILDPTPPDSVVLNVEDWQLVEEPELTVDLDPMLANIDMIYVWTEPKQEEFKKGIPPISQQPHSGTHCAPTAAAACLKYYEGQGDTEIGGGLTDHELVEALAKLARTNQGHSGTYPSDLADALKKWIAEHGDGYTVRGPKSFDWKEMRDELERCQDVLVGIYWPGGGGHRMTLNSIVNRPLPNGRIRIDFMDPWTGTIEYGELDPSTGHVSNYEGTSGNSGSLDNIIIVCPKEDDPSGGGGGGGGGIPGPDPGPIVIPFPHPGLYFLHVVVVDRDLNASRLIRVVDVQPYKPKAPTPYIKWSQPPIEIDPKSKTPVFCGWDEPAFCMDSPTGGPGTCRPVADDFRCLGDLPVTSIHWWGSYVGWEGLTPPQDRPIAYRIGFWTNVPVDAAGMTPYSHPGRLLQLVTVPASRVRIEWAGLDRFPQRPSDTCFQYNIDLNRDEWFWQGRYDSPDNVFWLSIAAVYPVGMQPIHIWGWKTRPAHWMDDGVIINTDVPLQPGVILPPQAFIPIENDLVGGLQSYDLAFELDTHPSYVKWDQPFTGIRLWPHYEDEESVAFEQDLLTIRRLVADDWRCTGLNPVTAITWWGSYIGYQYTACQSEIVMPEPKRPDYFWLSVWTDVPAGVDLPYSHPGEKIWEYKTNAVDEVMVGFDKHPEGPIMPPIIPGFEPVYRYSVRLPQERWFAQRRLNDVYWLSVVAVYKDPASMNYPWGWTNHSHTAWSGPSLTPVGHWKLDEASGRIASDSSPNANDATLVGDAAWVPGGGVLGGALNLDGNGDYAKTASTTTGLDFAPGSFTVSAWIHPRQTTGSWRTIVEYDRQGIAMSNWFGMWLSSTGKVHFRVGLDTMNSATSVVANDWTLTTATYDSTTGQMKVYIDASPDGTATHANGFGLGRQAKLTIGVRGYEDDEFFDGLLDDIRIYNQALTADQVGLLLTVGRNDDAVAGHPGPIPGMPAQWEELYDQTGVSEDMSFTLFTEPGCMPTCHPDYWEWLKVGRPDCWCLPTQCYGDADGLTEGSAKTGLFHVHFRDLNVLIASWNVKEPPHGPGIATVVYTDSQGSIRGICADYAHDTEGSSKTGFFRVHFNDLNILIANWNKAEPPMGPGVGKDCLNCP